MRLRHTSALALAATLLAAGCATLSGGGAQPIELLDGPGLEGWEQVGPGQFTVLPDGSIVSEGGMGLLYYAERPFRDFVLEMDWMAETPGANSGVFLRFPEPPADPWDAVEAGYEVQIAGTGGPMHSTGAVYDFAAAAQPAARPEGEWNRYRIEVQGQRYRVFLNGVLVNDFFGKRGREGYIGLQNHDEESRVRFRDLRVTPLSGEGAPERLADLFRVTGEREPIRVLMLTATHGWRHADAIEAAREVLGELEETTELEVEATEDVGVLTPETLAGYDVVLLANATLRATPPEQGDGGAAYDFRIATPEGEAPGRVVLSGGAETPAGSISIAGMPAIALEEVAVEGEQWTFAFEIPGYGRITGAVTPAGDELRGTLTSSQGSTPLVGARAGAAAPAGGASGLVQSYTPVTDAQVEALLDFVRRGGGLAVAHSGLDALHGVEGYREMVGGGLFESHPWTQQVRVDVEDAANPAVAHLGDGFWLRDEIYVLDRNPRWNSRVLLSLNLPSVGLPDGTPTGSADDYPISWIRTFGEGRVFATSLGHFPDVWRSPAYLQHLLQGIRIAAGRVPADFSGRREKETVAADVWPDDVVVDERGNVWIAELTGKIFRKDAESGELSTVAEIETTDPVNIEHGLYGIEVDPEFYAGQPYVYVFRAEPESFVNVLSRFAFRDGALDMGSERVLLRVPTEPACCHQAGDLEWGPDGTLFVSTGDTGQSGTKPEHEISEERIAAFVERNALRGHHWSRLTDSERTSQNLQDLRGKILRINRDGTIPRDNPFFGEPGVRWEIYAYGLRNPYRIQYDPPTGRVYVGVVGPDEQVTYDEYNVLEAGGGQNFGWPRDNGLLFYNEWTPEMIPDWTPPIWEYTYATGSRSATAGPVYRSTGPRALPERFQGKAFVYDWSRRWIKYGELANGTFASDTAASVRSDGRQIVVPAKRLTDLKTFDVLETTSPISMDVGPDGCLYLAEFTGFWSPAPGSNVSRYCWTPAADAVEPEGR